MISGNFLSRARTGPYFVPLRTPSVYFSVLQCAPCPREGIMNLPTTWSRIIYKKIYNIHKVGGYVTRDAVTLADYKVHWYRPEKVSPLLPEKSGDLGLNIEVKPTEYRLHYDRSKELQDASDIVKKMFTLEFNSNAERFKVKREKTVNLVKRHACDMTSEETRIARMTALIQELQEYMQKHPRNRKRKVLLKETIDKRNKALKLLRASDYKRFDWILEHLNLFYKPVPEQTGWVPRREALRRITEEHCNNIVQSKLSAYRAELQAQQKDFYREKVEKLEFIRKEELECGVTPTVSEEDIKEARERMEALLINQD